MHKQSALVVGASRGIGLAVVKHLSALEADVVATWNSTLPENTENNVTWRQADITQAESLLSLSVNSSRTLTHLCLTTAVVI
ncbi:hypothetical protein [Pantoea dispersa]|uniref:hypothetical protein n=1 Tax=Pantoea dispersa TaxID=59814 RepID=UPI001BA75727|nr:hypothetical protein [Pantoea dispersa]MBS0900198.1 hypothetical protein [Pantoea dispersa]